MTGTTKRKVAVIGVGHVGAHCAYSLAVQGICDELLLIDANEGKVRSERQDLFDSIAMLDHNVAVEIGTFSDVGDADVIVNAVGDVGILAAHNDRLDEMNFTIHAVNGYADKIVASGFDGVILNITNPCDVVTYRIAQLTGLPRGRVLGTGTGLDTSRLIGALSAQSGIDHRSITGFMLGEHGASQFAPWSQVRFGGRSLESLAAEDARFDFDRDNMQRAVINAGWVTFSGKQCTEYGIATTCARMVDIILRDEKRIVAASAELCGEYGETGLFVGVPVVLGAAGVERVIELDLTPAEHVLFAQCCADVRDNMARIPSIL